jgi:hypothetical protein
MRFYSVPVNQSVPTEANRGLTSYIHIVGIVGQHTMLLHLAVQEIKV